jgi:protein-disulfide isomerase
VSNRAEKRRASRADGRGGRSSSGSNSFRWVLIGVGVLAAGIVIWNMAFSTGGEGARAPVSLDDVGPQELIQLAQGMERGDPDAPIVLMDFSDYSCPSCAAFTNQAKPYLEMNYIDSGLVRFVYYDFPLGGMFQHSFLAARAARCAGDQGGYWEFHDRLFQRQGEWSRQTDPFSSFVGYADDIGMARSEFRSCLGSDRHADVVTANMQLGQQLGVSGTPTIFLNAGEGRAERVESWSPTQLGAQINAALARIGYGEESEGSAEADTAQGGVD